MTATKFATNAELMKHLRAKALEESWALRAKLQPVPVLPAQPLQALTGNLTQLAELIGVSRETMHRYLRDGIPLYRADTIATRLGVHPLEVWGNDYLNGAA